MSSGFIVCKCLIFLKLLSLVINNNHQCPYGGNGNVEHLYADSKEVYEKLLAAKDEQITLLMRLLEMKLK